MKKKMRIFNKIVSKLFFLFISLINHFRKILSKKKLLTTVLGLILVICFFKAFEETNVVEKIHSQNLKAVQLITQRFYFPNWGFEKLGRHPFLNCPENRCFAFHTHFWRNKPYESSDGKSFFKHILLEFKY